MHNKFWMQYLTPSVDSWFEWSPGLSVLPICFDNQPWPAHPVHCALPWSLLSADPYLPSIWMQFLGKEYGSQVSQHNSNLSLHLSGFQSTCTCSISSLEHHDEWQQVSVPAPIGYYWLLPTIQLLTKLGMRWAILSEGFATTSSSAIWSETNRLEPRCFGSRRSSGELSLMEATCALAVEQMSGPLLAHASVSPNGVTCET